jgi:hypothetical protein
LTFPEVIASFQGFLRTRVAGGECAVIGIDELDADSSSVLGWLGAWKPDLHKAAPADLPAPDRASLPELREFLAIRLLGVTLVDFFTDARSRDDYECAQLAGPGGFEQLAGARQALAIDAELSWRRTVAFRTFWNL